MAKRTRNGRIAHGQPCSLSFLPNALHSHAATTTFLSPNVRTKFKCSATTSTLVDLALKTGVSHVTIMIRKDQKVIPFDVDLAWMGKFKNDEKAAFWSADTDEQRLSFIKSAREGRVHHAAVREDADAASG